MERKYDVQSTSRRTAKVQDVWLAQPDEPEKALTRRVLRSEIVDNARDNSSPLKVCLVAQKRHSPRQPWQDVDSFSLSQMKAGEEVRLALDCAQTKHLHEALTELYAVAHGGVPRGEQTLIVGNAAETYLVKGKARYLVKELLEEGDEELWNEIAQLQPNLFRALALSKLHTIREEAVAEFEEHLHADDWTEPEWQTFFEANTWIFGYGLQYRFLQTVQAQPDYGGRTLKGSGGQRGDFLMATEAETRFTVLVEIKKPNSPLVSIEYRQKVYLLGKHLIGGVSQLQSNCRTWDRDGSRQDENWERLSKERTHTFQPKGILVIGHTEQLDERNKLATFELFRAGLHGIDVITFDELLARARSLLLNEQDSALNA